MLNSMRDAAQSNIVKLLLLLLVASFALWGIGDVFRGGSGGTVATVGDTRLSQTSFDYELQEEIRRFTAMFGKPPTPDIHPMMAENVVRRFVERSLIEQEAHRLGMVVTEGQIANNIKKDESFQKDGVFDHKTYLAALDNARLSETSYVTMLRQEMLSRLLLGNMAGSSVPLTQQAKHYEQFLDSKHSMQILRLPASTSLTIPAATDEELKAFYEKNKESFATSEYRAFAYSIITADSLKTQPDITEADITSYYETHKQLFADDTGTTEPLEKVKDRITSELMESKKEETLRAIATKFDDAFAGGSKLAEAAKELGYSVATTPTLSTEATAPDGQKHEIPAGLKPHLARIMGLDATQGGVVLELADGSFAAIEVTETIPSSIPAFETVKAKVLDGWKKDRATSLRLEKAKAIAAAWKSEEDAGKISQTFGLAAPTSITATRRAPDASVLQLVQAEAMELPIGGVTEPHETPDGTWLIAKKTAYTLPETIGEDRVKESAKQLLPMWYGDVMHYYNNYMRRTHGVTISLPPSPEPAEPNA